MHLKRLCTTGTCSQERQLSFLLLRLWKDRDRGWMRDWDELMDHAGWMGIWARRIMGG